MCDLLFMEWAGVDDQEILGLECALDGRIEKNLVF